MDKIMEHNICWLIQDRNITPNFTQDSFDLVKKLDLLHTGIWINKDNKIEGLSAVLNNNIDYIFRCGTKTIDAIIRAQNLSDLLPDSNTVISQADSMMMLEKLKKGIFFNSEKFNFMHYANLDLPLLNSDNQYYSFKNQGEHRFARDTFIKPSEDNKFFTGGIIPAGMAIKDFVNNISHINYDQDQLLVASSIKNIAAEYRFYVVQGEIVTYSGYKFAGINKYFREMPKQLLEIATTFAKIYQPHEVFVMDIAETNGQYKIVEYNCLNGASLYGSDKAKLFYSLEDYMKNTALDNKQSYNMSATKTKI